jgi:transcriptional regulator with XRE-family HTH domain
MTTDRRSLGEYIRRLRRDRKWSLLKLAEEAEVSYSYLSRVENDVIRPSADVIARIAGALDADLRWMLTEAQALPEAILDRLDGSAAPAGRVLKRRAGPAASSSDGFEQAAAEAGLAPADAAAFAAAVRELLRLPSAQRRAVQSLIASFEETSP